MIHIKNKGVTETEKDSPLSVRLASDETTTSLGM